MKKQVRLVTGLTRFLRGRVEPAEALELARDAIRTRMRKREENFLAFATRAIFENPASPYLKLLDAKRIALSDVERWVSDAGIESALATLRDEGVYFTIDEYKGTVDVHRNGVRFRLDESDFDNPFLSTAYYVQTGATRSAGRRVRIDFDYLVQRSSYDAVLLHLHDALTAPVANWFPVFPGAPGINASLRFARIGNPPREWFSQVDQDELDLSRERRVAFASMLAISRLLRAPLPRPEFVDLNNALRVAEWASNALQESPTCVVYTFASSAVRVCMTAREHGLDLRGARFLVTGEPLTLQKRREIESVGARAVPVYGISEAGVIAAGCSEPYAESDHCHVYSDTTAVSSYRRHVPECDDYVDALLFSSLLDDSPKVLLNVEMGDYGSVVSKPCSCEFGVLGMESHLSGIRSFEKLTGEGVSFVNTDFVQLVEEVLPRRFGGESTDYQLVEVEGASGITRLNLMISPRVGTIDEPAAVAAFIGGLQGSKDGPLWAQSGPKMWGQTGTVNVVRDYPMATKRGKILPFHLFKEGESEENESAPEPASKS